jgi:hypothetical protein
MTSPVVDALKILFNHGPQAVQQIKNGLSPGVYTSQVDYSEYVRPTGMYNKEWRSFRRSALEKRKDYSDTERVLWTKCCVCQKVTRANLPWYKRVIFIRSPFAFESTFKPFIQGRWATWGVCSDECLNMFYLGNEV